MDTDSSNLLLQFASFLQPNSPLLKLYHGIRLDRHTALRLRENPVLFLSFVANLSAYLDFT